MEYQKLKLSNTSGPNPCYAQKAYDHHTNVLKNAKSSRELQDIGNALVFLNCLLVAGDYDALKETLETMTANGSNRFTEISTKEMYLEEGALWVSTTDAFHYVELGSQFNEISWLSTRGGQVYIKQLMSDAWKPVDKDSGPFCVYRVSATSFIMEHTATTYEKAVSGARDLKAEKPQLVYSICTREEWDEIRKTGKVETS